MKIEVSETTFRRLQALAEPFVDTPEAVIVKLLNTHRTKGAKIMSSAPALHPSTAPAVHDEPLRGFQREMWELVILRLPTQRFTLRDVYAREKSLAELRPHVKELRASIRGCLEKLRDKGYVEFVDNQGEYRRLK